MPTQDQGKERINRPSTFIPFSLPTKFATHIVHNHYLKPNKSLPALSTVGVAL